MNEDVQTQEETEEVLQDPVQGEDIQEIDPESLQVQTEPESLYNIDDIVLRLDNLERIQVTFFDNLLDVLLIALAVLLAGFVVREFMDRSTKW